MYMSVLDVFFQCVGLHLCSALGSSEQVGQDIGFRKIFVK